MIIVMMTDREAGRKSYNYTTRIVRYLTMLCMMYVHIISIHMYNM